MIPQEWRAKYQEAIQDYQQSNQTAPSEKGQALEQAAGYCNSILTHPAFGEAPVSFRLLMLGEGSETYLDLYIMPCGYKIRGREEDLNDAFSFLEAALELALADSDIKPELKSNMAIALRERYRRTGNIADLQQAMTTLTTTTAIQEVKAPLL